MKVTNIKSIWSAISVLRIFLDPIHVFSDVGVNSGLIETGAVVAATHDADDVSFVALKIRVIKN